MSGERAGHRAKSLAGQLSVRRNYIRKTLAEVAKLADAQGLGPGSSRSAGSTPALGTKQKSPREGDFLIFVLAQNAGYDISHCSGK